MIHIVPKNESPLVVYNVIVILHRRKKLDYRNVNKSHKNSTAILQQKSGFLSLFLKSKYHIQNTAQYFISSASSSVALDNDGIGLWHFTIFF